MKLTCLLCNRNKFKRKVPHKCAGGYRKRKIIWGVVIEGIGLWSFKTIKNKK